MKIEITDKDVIKNVPFRADVYSPALGGGCFTVFDNREGKILFDFMRGNTSFRATFDDINALNDFTECLGYIFT